MLMYNADVDAMAARKNSVAFGRLSSSYDADDRRESEIQSKADDLYERLNPDDSLKIEEIIIRSCGLKDINPDNTEKAIKLLLSLEAEYLIDKKHEEFEKYGEW